MSIYVIEQVLKYLLSTADPKFSPGTLKVSGTRIGNYIWQRVKVSTFHFEISKT